MRDEAIAAAPAKTAAGQAVLYLLRRMRVDVNLRWYMLATEAFALLCKAEAERSGRDVEAVTALYSDLAENYRDYLPSVVRQQRQLERIRDLCAEARHVGASPNLLADLEAVLGGR